MFIQPLTPDGVRMVQARLKAMNSYPGLVDGIWGPGSQTALRNFQQSRGLQATGDMNPATAATLGLDPVTLVASAAPPPPLPAPVPVFTISGDSMRIIQAMNITGSKGIRIPSHLLQRLPASVKSRLQMAAAMTAQ